MDRNQVRQVITAQFYQSLAENRVQVQSIPQDELQGLVNALADGVFAAVAALEDEAIEEEAPSTARGVAPAEPANEVKLWRGRPFLSIGVIYELTSQRLRIIRGIFGNVIEEIELVRVKDTRVKQHAGERMLDVGDITVISTDPSTPEKVLHNVSDPLAVRELIRNATMEEKQRRGLLYREELN
ncbi:MAG: PH domain-containing protein [Caldilineaceae bacterium]|nr:PH domain-containing protein [Caldilineaceae bacterium]